MDDENIISLSCYKARFDNSLWTPAEMLEETAREHCADGKYKSAIVILMSKEDDDYDFGYRSSNLKKSEAIALLEIVKTQLVEDLLGG